MSACVLSSIRDPRHFVEEPAGAINCIFQNMLPFKAFTVIMLLLVVLVSCDFKTTGSRENKLSVKDSSHFVSVDADPVTSVPKDSIPPTQIGDGLVFSFKFFVDTIESGNLDSIRVYSCNALYQTLFLGDWVEKENFDLVDWNFDGYRDITALCNCGSGGCAYYIWNYSAKTRKFVYNERLSGKLGLEIDTIEEKIIFHYRAGWDWERWDTFIYVNDELSFLKGRHSERWKDTLGNTWERNTFSFQRNGKEYFKVDSSVTN